MTDVQHEVVGRLATIWRYPVKSMMGEELNASEVTGRGLLGDRAFALIDGATSKVVSAKNPRQWGPMFDFRAAYAEPPHDAQALPAVRITCPDGVQVLNTQPEAEERVSERLGRPVRLAAAVPETPTIDGYWPDYDWLEAPDQSFEHVLPEGTFFDLGLVHLVTTATLDALRERVPRSRFEARRFRPNLVIETAAGLSGFVESGWLGRTLALGDEVRLQINEPTPRCVMTTLPQGDLPKDPGVLRAAVEQNGGNVGVYAAVLRGGRVRRGDPVRLE
jgi:uncharacterized protein YcbX